MGRREGRATDDVEAQLAHIRHAIIVIGDQIAAARTGAGATIVSRAELDRTLREQKRTLDAARAEISSAAQAARVAADAAHEDAGPAAAVAYERAEAGFAAQLKVVELALEQLSHLSTASTDTGRQAAQLLRDTQASLAAALRQQVSLLARLERAQRELAVGELRRDPDPDPG